MKRHLLTTVTLLCLITHGVPGQVESRPTSAPSPIEFDFTAPSEPRDVLIELEISTKGNATLKSPSGETTSTVDNQTFTRTLDRLVARDPASRVWSLRRHWLDSTSDTSTGRLDSGLAGAVATLSLREDLRWDVSLDASRIMTQDRLQQIIRQANFSAGELPMTGKWALGSGVDLSPCTAIFETLFDVDGVLSMKEAMLKISEFDEANGRVLLVGRARFEVNERGVPGVTTTHAATIAVAWSTTTRQVESIAYRSKATIAGKFSDGEMTGEMSVEGRYIAKNVDNGDELAAAAPTFRSIRRGLLGANMEVPSNWISAAATPQKSLVLRNSLFGDVVCEVRFSVVASSRPLDNAAYQTGFIGGLRKAAPDIAGKWDPNLGGGALRFHGTTEKGQIVGVLVRATSEHLVMIVLAAPESHMKDAEMEFEAMLATLKIEKS